MKKPKRSFLYSLLGIAFLLVYFFLQSPGQSGTPGTPGTTVTPLPPTPSGVPVSIGPRTKTSDCVAANGMQDFACTPGAIFPDVTKDDICVPGYTSKVRNVPDSVKNAVYAEYGITSHTTGQYEVDHLISLELGGSNDIANLWPEAAEPRPGFHEKDKVENYLHQQVCNGSMTLQEAQLKIAYDWLSVYKSLP
jgi:hypothetical protein